MESVPDPEILKPSKEFDYILSWLVGEHLHQYHKIDRQEDDRYLAEEGIGEDTYWDRQLVNYLDRSRLLGLETPNGRQALAKFLATAYGLLESTVRVHGPLPKPGVSSGNGLDDMLPLPE